MPKWLKIVLAIVAGIALIVVVTFSIAFWATSGLVEPVERQLAALKAGNMEAAYAETSQAFRQATPLPAFTAFVDQNPILKDAAGHSVTSRSFENDVGSLQASLTSTSGAVTAVKYQLVWESDAWKIVHIKLEPAGTN